MAAPQGEEHEILPYIDASLAGKRYNTSLKRGCWGMDRGYLILVKYGIRIFPTFK